VGNEAIEAIEEERREKREPEQIMHLERREMWLPDIYEGRRFSSDRKVLSTLK
jgi:hypothetical protein